MKFWREFGEISILVKSPEKFWKKIDFVNRKKISLIEINPPKIYVRRDPQILLMNFEVFVGINST